METGYVKFWRNAKENPILANDNNAFIVFTRLLIIVDRHTGSYTTGRKKLAVYMNMKESTLYKVLKRLELASMLECKSNSHVTTFFICNWAKWQQEENKIVTKSYGARSTKQEREREDIDTKVSINKVIPSPKTPSTSINEMFEYWQEQVGYAISAKQKPNRYACANLLKKCGEDGVKQLIKGVGMAQNDKYAPRISDFCDLQSNLNKLLAWGKNPSGDLKKVVSI